MTDPYSLQRFLDAQANVFEAALGELRSGAKLSHWMWFIFPQLRGLGRSSTAQFYGLGSRDEARAYLEHPLLGPRLRACVDALLPWAGSRSSAEILGPIDALKLRSCLTLFEVASGEARFGEALDAFYAGERDEQTLALLNCRR